MRYIPRKPSPTFEVIQKLLQRLGSIPAALVPVGMARARAAGSPVIEVIPGTISDYGRQILFELGSFARRFSLPSSISIGDLEREVGRRLPGLVG
jgi:hypothetical protein